MREANIRGGSIQGGSIPLPCQSIMKKVNHHVDKVLSVECWGTLFLYLQCNRVRLEYIQRATFLLYVTCIPS